MQSCIKTLPDYAMLPDGSGMALEKVGIKNFKQFQRDFSGRRTLTTQAAYVDLSGQNGIHMSRLIGILQENVDKFIQVDTEMLEDIMNSHETPTAFWECSWDSAHEMEDEQLLFVKCMLEGVLTEDTEDWFLTVRVPYASVCPCASAMCEQEESGVPHMQRAEAQVTGLINPKEDLDELLTTVVSRVINAVDLVPIPYMKRPAELEWCQRAEQTQLFVEDAARVIGQTIDGFMEDWVVICTHQESIHQHDVVSVCRKGKRLL
jgi:GTP cyclohydrolase I